MQLPDVQDSTDDRGIAIDEVGVSNVRLPFTFDDGLLSQRGVASVAVTVALAALRRGTHMSRMIERAEALLSPLDPRSLAVPMKELAAYLEAETARLTVEFPLATAVTAPVSGISSQQVHDVAIASIHSGNGLMLKTCVTSDITTLCPCSQAVSDYGAHNQRSRVSIEVRGDGSDPYPVSVSALVDLIRGVGSAPVIPVIKRPDERHLTMQAFDSPAFVEDVIRDLSVALRGRGVSHRVRSVNVESIHSHDAVAELSWSAS